MEGPELVDCLRDEVERCTVHRADTDRRWDGLLSQILDGPDVLDCATAVFDDAGPDRGQRCPVRAAGDEGMTEVALQRGDVPAHC